MLLTVLGTATPYPRPDEPCSGYLVQSGDGGARSTTVWVDAGTGTLAELQRHTALDELDAIFISHRHADHSADLLVAYYALRFAELRPTRPIPLIGPEGLLDRLAAYLGPSSVDELPRVFDVTPMSGWGERPVGDLTLSWGPVQHGVPAFGLTVDEAAPGGRRRLAYSGDSAPCLSLEEIAEDADLLLCEAGYAEAPSPAAPAAASATPAAEAPVHHTPADAGRTATAARASRLVLTHLAGTLTPEAALAAAAPHFTGPTAVAHPGARYPV